MKYFSLEHNSIWTGCFSPSRFFALFAIISGSIAVLIYLSNRLSYPYYRDAFAASVGLFTSVSTSLIPEACHDEHKTIIRIGCIASAIMIAVAISANSNSELASIEFVTIMTGAVGSILEWVLKLLLCNDTFRKFF
jgi:hypothetical protein